MRSSSNYYLTSFADRKTRSEVDVKEVSALPLKHAKVVLDSVHIYGNMEEDGDTAEVELRARVGVVGDQKSDDAKTTAYTNGAPAYATVTGLPFMDKKDTFRRYNGIADNVDLPIEENGLTLMDKQWSAHNNVASFYVQIGLYENDEGGNVNDDMIGVLS
jgi:hypothetical protein